GSFPNAAGDVAQFTASYSTAQTATINQAITVGEIDFGTSKNITINNSGGSVLTLDNPRTAANAVLNVGSGSFTNTGADLVTAPLVVAAATPLTAPIGGGTLQLTNTANPIGSSSTLTVNSGGSLRESAAGSGSLGTGTLADTGAL